MISVRYGTGSEKGSLKLLNIGTRCIKRTESIKGTGTVKVTGTVKGTRTVKGTGMFKGMVAATEMGIITVT